MTLGTLLGGVLAFAGSVLVIQRDGWAIGLLCEESWRRLPDFNGVRFLESGL